ncbi:aconitate hydratase AcnA [Colwellia sp. 6_MG-2023]|uniref:aconitate hydratase AcnA n=1 Tax=Colwellia sp. 6_MG-2023 TaxID=3062676 RepID=UPI0026E35102|nr:aconitate hydratase AcnA [Colwellia sp. 6_MG-2023]MDO6489643.1 aconitate hydratase AcnA [Colwellia sp. 6_MG-2023]
MTKSIQSLKPLEINGETYHYYSFDSLAEKYDISRLPFAAKILLENLLRHAEHDFVQQGDIETLVKWDVDNWQDTEISFVPSRVVLQDFTGVPAVVDLAAMRDAIVKMGGSADKINPLNPVELVIDHSVMVDVFGKADAMEQNTAIEFQRNKERYQFLRWGQQSFDNFKVVPPGRGIVHQVNLEYLARVVFKKTDENNLLYPDTLVGTDSHTTMINGLGVLGWGVGGIEAEAAMLGQPVTMLLPEIVGFELKGKLPSGTTATDLVLTVTEQLRAAGVVGKFVEFFGSGVNELTLADRATIANMAPEYGATCGIFPIDSQTIDYLRLTGRDSEHIERIKLYLKTMGMWGTESQNNAVYNSRLSLQLETVVPSIAGPKRPQDRISLDHAGAAYQDWLTLQHGVQKTSSNKDESGFESEGGQPSVLLPASDEDPGIPCKYGDEEFILKHGSVVIAAITSCTNTSNPSVLIAAGLLARNARQRGLTVKPWVKTSLAPGSQVVTDYLHKSGLNEDLDALGFQLVGYGCTTCIGNSGPLPLEISEAIHQGDLSVTSVLSGNRNFEGRIHPEIQANYLASPPLVVAYALAGNMKIDITTDSLGDDDSGNPVYLHDIWPDNHEIKEVIKNVIDSSMFTSRYADIYNGNKDWQNMEVVQSQKYDWPDSTYVKLPPFFDNISAQIPEIKSIENARCLLKLGDSVTTDHISPAGSIALDSPAAEYLKQEGVSVKDFNSYGSRRGNHEVMMRGTFANVRLRNLLAPGTEGCWTRMMPSGAKMSVFDAAMQYQQQKIASIVLAGKEYGTGSSRDWAAKGPALLGVKAVIAQSYERIHRSNLVGMGILPLQFMSDDSADSLNITGEEKFSIPAVKIGQKTVTVFVTNEDGNQRSFEAKIRIDTPNEFSYYQHGGILHYVLRNLATT